MSFTSGPFSFNRFEEFEKYLNEGEGASSPAKMKEVVDDAAKQSKKEGKKLSKADEKEEEKRSSSNLFQ